MLRILHVDDDFLDHKLTSTNLVNQGDNLEIRWADSAKAALIMLEAEKFDCILSDYQMPEMNGLEFLLLLREREMTIPFIFLTGQGSETLAAEALRAGADDYYTKEEGFAHYERLIASIQRNVGSYRSIARLRRAEKENLASRERFEQLMEQAPFPIELYDIDGLQIAVNPAYEALWGIRAEDSVGVFNVKTAKQAEALGLKDYVRRAYAGESVQLPDFEWNASAEIGVGRSRFIRTKLFPLKDEDGTISGIAIVHEDITAQEAAKKIVQDNEKKLRALVSNISDVIVILDGQGVITYVSPNVTKQFGWQTDNLIGRHGLITVHPDDHARIGEAITNILATPHNEITVEYRFLCQDATIRDVELTAVNLLDNPEIAGILATYTDITRRKIAEGALRTSEAQLSNAMKIAGLGYWEYDIDAGYFTFNDHFYNIFRTTAEEMGGYRMTIEEYANRFVHPEDGPLVAIETRKAIETTDPDFNRQIEHRIFYADGEPGYISVRFFIQKDENGRTIKTFGANQDITERKRAEEALKQSEYRYRRLAESSPGVAYQFQMARDGKFSFPYIGQNVRDLIGVDKEAIVADATALLGLIDKNAIDIFTNKVIQSAQNLTMYHDIIPVPFAGEKRFYEARATPEKMEDGSVLWDGFLVDVTEQKRAEEALLRSEKNLAIAQRIASIGSWKYDVKSRNLHLSDEMSRIFGFVPGPVRGLDEIKKVVHPDNLKIFVRIFKDAQAGTSPDPVEFRILLPNGHERSVQLRAQATYDSSGALLKLEGTVQDISERKKSEDDLRKSYEQLTAVNKELEAFSYSVSHDLKAPLRQLRGMANILCRKYSETIDEEDKQLLLDMQTVSGRMTRLIEALLQLSRVQQVTLLLKEVNLCKLARSILEELRKSDPEREVELVLPESLYATGDENLLKIVCENLLGNAWKFTGKKEQAVIEFGRDYIDGKETFFVKDNGDGFVQEKADKLFTPFQRLHTEEEFKGTGVGLATVQRIIHRHGGKIFAEGEPGKGATFYFTLS